MSAPNIKELVQEKYGEAAMRLLAGGSSCCGATTCCGTDINPITAHLYDAPQATQSPEDALKAFLGCGNPTALAQLNCVINLSADKDRVLREAFRVLKPGGRLAVSDVVTRGEMLSEIRERVLLWVGCIAGALEEDDYRSKLAAAGFASIEIEPTRIYRIEDARAFLSGQGIDVDAMAPQIDGKFMSAFIRATKPSNCCASDCCS